MLVPVTIGDNSDRTGLVIPFNTAAQRKQSEQLFFE